MHNRSERSIWERQWCAAIRTSQPYQERQRASPAVRLQQERHREGFLIWYNGDTSIAAAGHGPGELPPQLRHSEELEKS
jgi:hypothetical protein